jgi:hypothetical protein
VYQYFEKHNYFIESRIQTEIYKKAIKFIDNQWKRSTDLKKLKKYTKNSPLLEDPKCSQNEKERFHLFRTSPS